MDDAVRIVRALDGLRIGGWRGQSQQARDVRWLSDRYEAYQREMMDAEALRLAKAQFILVVAQEREEA